MSITPDAPEAPLSSYENISIEKAHDIIPISVGLYGMFLANGKDGMNALAVYQHLIYTARLQETNQPWANNVYIGNALPLGQESIRKAKTFLHRKGLIKYVQTRGESGQMGKTFIRICFISPSAILTEENPADNILSDVADLAPDTSAPTGDDPATLPLETATTNNGTPDAPDMRSTAHSNTGVPDDECTGDGRQMLEVSNEMLEVRKGISISSETAKITEQNQSEQPPPRRFSFNPNDTDRTAEKIGKDICRAWYSRYQSDTGRLQNMSPTDISTAISLVHQFPGLSAADGPALAADAVRKHFDLWKCAWYLTTEQTRKLPDEQKKPYWNFSTFCRFFGQILDLEAAVPGQSGETSAHARADGPYRGKGISSEERKAIVERKLAEIAARGSE
jgi:hypothetical protein